MSPNTLRIITVSLAFVACGSFSVYVAYQTKSRTIGSILLLVALVCALILNYYIKRQFDDAQTDIDESHMELNDETKEMLKSREAAADASEVSSYSDMIAKREAKETIVEMEKKQ